MQLTNRKGAEVARAGVGRRQWSLASQGRSAREGIVRFAIGLSRLKAMASELGASVTGGIRLRGRGLGFVDLGWFLWKKEVGDAGCGATKEQRSRQSTREKGHKFGAELELRGTVAGEILRRIWAAGRRIRQRDQIMKRIFLDCGVQLGWDKFLTSHHLDPKQPALLHAAVNHQLMLDSSQVDVASFQPNRKLQTIEEGRANVVQLLHTGNQKTATYLAVRLMQYGERLVTVNTGSQPVQLNMFCSIPRTSQRSGADRIAARRIAHKHGLKLEGSIHDFERIFAYGNEK
ncbi:hypothetical protein M5K25_016542 [Dendrobium thyrsiflorum]|uniref:Uncharacterized protein n=1 Tax=Dendrobium thyrsiflorum TaxID=117978 RepID=A0ABD0UKE2_DENTH